MDISSLVSDVHFQSKNAATKAPKFVTLSVCNINNLDLLQIWKHIQCQLQIKKNL